MLSGATPSAFAMAGPAVFRIVVSRDSMKKAIATNHGNSRFTDLSVAEGPETTLELAALIFCAGSSRHDVPRRYANPCPRPRHAVITNRHPAARFAGDSIVRERGWTRKHR